MDYVDTASKDIFYTNIVQNAKTHIRYMRARGGLDNSAEGIEKWIMEAYAGVLPGFSKFAIRVMPGPLRQGMLGVRRLLTRAVFTMNWNWNLFVQPGSGTMTIFRYGIKDTLKALSYITSPKIRQEVRDNAYSAIIKSRRGGRVAYQDVGSGIEKTASIQRSPIETAEDFGNALTALIEDGLTGISVRAAYHSGERMGLSGRALWEFASEGGSKTQSMYNLEDLPGILRAKETGAIAPFQTFSLEVMNNIRELGLPLALARGVGTGAYQTTQNRLLALARWTASIVVFAAIADRFVGRKPWQLSSFLPFWGLMLGGVNAGNPWNLALPHKYSNEFKEAVAAYMKYGNWTKLRTWAIGYHMYGGVQVNKTLKGIEAVADGNVKNVVGEKLFDTEPPEGWESLPGKWQAWVAITGGPYAVAEGKEYIDRLNDNPISEFLGIDLGEFQATEEERMKVKAREFTMMIAGRDGVAEETGYEDLRTHPSVLAAMKSLLPPDRHAYADEYMDTFKYDQYDKRKELIRNKIFRDEIEPLFQAQGRSGGELYYLRGQFARAAPLAWKVVAAKGGLLFDTSKDIRAKILELEEAGNGLPEINYEQWTFVTPEPAGVR